MELSMYEGVEVGGWVEKIREVSKMCSLYANVAEGLVRKVLECELLGGVEISVQKMI